MQAGQNLDINIRQHDPVTGVLTDMTGSQKVNEDRVSIIDLDVDGSGAPVTYGASRSVSAVVTQALLAAGAFTDENPIRSYFRVIHGSLPEGIRLNVGREATFTPDSIAGVLITPGGITPDPFEEVHPACETGGLAPSQKLYSFQDDATHGVGVIKLQLEKFATVPVAPYNPNTDLGNAGFIVCEFMVPKVEGTLSGRPTETALEATGSPLSRVLLRPVGLTDCPMWFQFGCLANEKEWAYEIEDAMEEKDYNKVISAMTQRTNLNNINCQAKAPTPALYKAMNAGRIKRVQGAVQVERRADGAYEEYEAILEVRSVKGFTLMCHIPRCVVKNNGSTTVSGTGQTAYPFQVKGLEPSLVSFDHNLWDSKCFVIRATVTT